MNAMHLGGLFPHGLLGLRPPPGDPDSAGLGRAENLEFQQAPR